MDEWTDQELRIKVIEFILSEFDYRSKNLNSFIDDCESLVSYIKDGKS